MELGGGKGDLVLVLTAFNPSHFRNGFKLAHSGGFFASHKSASRAATLNWTHGNNTQYNSTPIAYKKYYQRQNSFRKGHLECYKGHAVPQ